MTPPKRTGPRIAEIQNHLVRTRSTNSRRMTAHTLCTGANSCRCRGWNGGCGRRLRTHEVDENLVRSEEHTSELQSRLHLVCRLLLEKKKKKKNKYMVRAQ